MAFLRNYVIRISTGLPSHLSQRDPGIVTGSPGAILFCYSVTIEGCDGASDRGAATDPSAQGPRVRRAIDRDIPVEVAATRR